MYILMVAASDSNEHKETEEKGKKDVRKMRRQKSAQRLQWTGSVRSQSAILWGRQRQVWSNGHDGIHRCSPTDRRVGHA